MKQQEFLLENYSSFNLRDIFECGQCFRWNKEEDVAIREFLLIM